jgi:hypothetical protein
MSGSHARLYRLADCLEATTFYDDPASRAYHCNYQGGLAAHTENVRLRLAELTARLGIRWGTDYSPHIIAMGHDACKIGSYYWDDNERCYVRRENHPPGHGDLSVKIVKEWIELTEEEEACIRYHMGAYEGDQKRWKEMQAAMRKFPNIMYVQMADTWATNVMDKWEDGR